ncbi:AAA family ATPase [Devosia sp.]|uniref:AAA family ATPase n=1 Tax=Devosia sp. TaxID=1871048 RepID=UPI002FCA96CF
MPDLNDQLDDDDDAVTQGALAPSSLDARAALGQEALAHALTRKTRDLLSQTARVMILQIPTADWADLIAEALPKIAGTVVVKTATEMTVSQKIAHRVGSDTLRYLHSRRTIVYISQDPETILDETVLAAADARIVIPAPTPALLRKVIARVSKGSARGVTPDMASLPLPVILSAIRPGIPARACVNNLARALAFRPVATAPVSSVPLLTDLPLTASLRRWTDQTLADLAAVKAGTLPADQLVFGVFEGPPGTGKTLTAESLARTADWVFVPSSVGAWFTDGDGALGGVARNLKRFVDQVLAAEPCVGYMDELDGLPNRATMDNRGRDFWTPVVNQFLLEIDRLRKSGKRVLLLGGTNYFNRLDAALVRSQRLQQRVTFLPPQDAGEVVDVLRHFLRDELAEVDLRPLARIGLGATPAVIEGWVKEARGAARAAGRHLQSGDLLAQMAPKDDRSAADIRAVALHEAGHALVAHRLGHAVETLSIIPEGSSGGHVRSSLPSLIHDLALIRDTATVMLGGRAADIVLGNGANSGAERDLEHATRILLAAHERQGLGDTLVYLPAVSTRPNLETVTAVAEDLRILLDRAIAIVTAERDLALDLADCLIAARVLSEADLADHLDRRHCKETAPSAAGPSDAWENRP